LEFSNIQYESVSRYFQPKDHHLSIKMIVDPHALNFGTKPPQNAKLSSNQMHRPSHLTAVPFLLRAVEIRAETAGKCTAETPQFRSILGAY
jgi:hypothetical protein